MVQSDIDPPGGRSGAPTPRLAIGPHEWDATGTPDVVDPTDARSRGATSRADTTGGAGDSPVRTNGARVTSPNREMRRQWVAARPMRRPARSPRAGPECEHSGRTAGATTDRQRPGDEHGSVRRQS